MATRALFFNLLLHISRTLAQSSCPADLLESCAAQSCCNDNNDDLTQEYNCSLPGLQDYLVPGQYEGVQVNYLSFATETSSPNLPVRAREFEACTGGRILFSEATNVWEDPLRDLGTQTARGSELYDGYFMSYSYFTEASSLDLAEHLNDRVRKDNARLQWEDVLPTVKKMGEFRKDGVTNIDFLMYDGDFFVPIIRLDLLEQHGKALPNTWDEVVELAKFFNGTDLNDDGEPDYGICHFPRVGGGFWDERWTEALYSTWATVSQSQGIQQGFFFDEDTMAPKLNAGFRQAAAAWKDLWNHGGEGCITNNFITGRCAIGFSPPGCWKGVFLDPDGVSRKDENGTVIWQPTMKNGDYAEPYRFKPFGSQNVIDPVTGELTKCTPKLCPKAERIPDAGHWGDQDRASQVLPSSPMAGELINRAPFYWSGGLGTLIRKSSPTLKKDLMWDFFVYTNSPEASVYDVANYASWLDSWRYSQLNARNNFLEAGWSTAAYEEHAAVMTYALSNEVNGAFNLRLPGSSKYTRDALGERMQKFIQGSLSLDELVEEISNEWTDITDQQGKLEQLEIYRSSLGLDLHSNVEICRLHRELMDERDPSICRQYDDDESNTLLIAILVPVTILGLFGVAAIAAYVFMEQKKRQADSVWKVDPDELEFGTVPQIIGYGSFGVVLLAEYRGTKVAVKKVIPELDQGSDDKNDDKRGHSSDASPYHRSGDTEMGGGSLSNPGLMSMGVHSTRISRDSKNHMDLKRMTPAQLQQKRRILKKDFIVEMRTLAVLRHPNITTTMGAVLAHGQDPQLVMEYMENGSLYDAFRNETIDLNSQEDILVIAQDIAHGMRFLHEANVIHGDLKSRNVLIDSNFRAKVADFGLSAKCQRGGARGTPYWMAPELLTESSSNTVMSDIYAFGILLYEVYSRKEPYEGEDYEAVISAVSDPAVRKRPPVPSLCPPTVSALMTDCLRHSPEERPSSKEVDTVLQSEGTIQGRIIRIAALNKDLVEENRQISSEQAVQLGHFACMSHEIRTPLNCIIGVSSLLEEDDKLDRSYKESVKMIVSSSRLLKQVVDDVLDFSKFVSGNAEIDIQRTDLQETLTSIINSMAMSPITERKEISLRTFYDPLVPQFVETDDRRLQQILFNLLSNAVKFSKDGSNVDLLVFMQNASNTTPRLHLQVKDYGMGIKKSDFEKIFQPFQQTDVGIKSVDGGTGLGLAITKQLVELLGGSISVYSEFGKWTTFSFELPLTASLVDTELISNRLKSCCVWVVGDMQSETNRMEEICKHFAVSHKTFGSLKEMEAHLVSSREKLSLICLVQEDLYDSASYEIISKKVKTVLVTFGQKGGKMDLGELHYQSLTRKFPSVILQEIASINEYASLTRKNAPKKQESTSEGNYSQLKILVAEDNKMNQKILVRMLERLGVANDNIQVANNGQEAVDLEAEDNFDIIFMDIQMPIMDGMEACRLIISHERSVCPKIVFLSANLASDYANACKEIGATDYLAKPVAINDLRLQLHKLMGEEQ